MLKKLIIGKHSKIVKDIIHSLDDWDCISHSDICCINFSEYDVVCLFSWAKENNEDNLKMISLLPAKKLIFISSVAVLSLNHRKQYSPYPINKKQCEELVLDRGGRVIRIGAWDEMIIEKCNGAVAYTTKKQLIDFLEKYSLRSDEKIINLFCIKRGHPSYFNQMLSGLYERCFSSPNTPQVINILISFVMKVLKIPNYGYTADSNRFFSDELVVGYGAIAGGCSKSLNKKKYDYLICDKNDIVFNENGFSMFRVGYSQLGLSKYWHGVSVRSSGFGNFRKVVPFWMKRVKLPSNYKKGCLSSINRDGEMVVLQVSSSCRNEMTYYANKVILSTGALENVRILAEYSTSDAVLSDHEVGYVGTISISDAVNIGLIKKYGKFIFHNKYKRGWISRSHYIVDARPLVKQKINSQITQSFYLDQTLNIVLKILKNMSLERLNEAFFNKYGFGYGTNKIALFAQLEAIDSIKYTVGSGYSRERIDALWLSFFNYLKNTINSFEPVHDFYSIDGLHPMGAAELLKNEKIQKILSDGKLIIFGSPTTNRLYGLHNTDRMIKEALGKI